MPQTCFDADPSKKDLKVFPFRYNFIRSHTASKAYKTHETATIKELFDELSVTGVGVMPTLARVHTTPQRFTPKSTKNGGKKQRKDTTTPAEIQVLPAVPAYS